MPTIVPISKLNNTSEISALAHESDGPVFVIKNGYGDMVLMSMEVYEALAGAVVAATSLLSVVTLFVFLTALVSLARL